MFEEDRPQSVLGSKWAIGCRALLSLMALVVTVWILADVHHEQEIVEELIRHLPDSDLADANQLAGELRLQSRLAVLLILNTLASCAALVMLVRAYISSERSLRKVRVLATDILASLDHGVITTDSDAAILSINPRGRELLHQSNNGIGVALTALPDEHRTLDELCRDVLRQQHTVSDFDYVVHHNGNIRNLRAGCSLLRDHDQRQIGTVIHVRDVTEKTLMEQRLLRMERYMGLGSLAVGLQHEIKNPLSALSLHVQLLKEALHGEPDATTVDESLDVLSTEVRRIAGVLEGFRDFASVAQLNFSRVDLNELIRKLVKFTDPQARNQNIRLETDLPDGRSPQLLLDPVRIEQVLLNLLLNAFSAMPEGGTVTIRLQMMADSVAIEVADSGCGIPDDFRDKVFDPYFTTRGTGTGMGLALCEKIVRQHDGTIEFTSSANGTTFVVTLPLK
ncbi:MAG: PAS domain-containing protein [Planctomycetaceae bacterium]|nr:PAS domain-containing protein [Planctomycetales bacterium]MCB9875882.1 PAS domain-containing protein [Planctomycetaceae bacterium]MCB9941748.1 PAS domain-containing protein [Planctomycetaceae bacterium]HRX79738.1 ATP-binding protein [Pirellulaceae bacterium]